MEELPSTITWRLVTAYPQYEVADATIHGDMGVIRNVKTKKIMKQYVSSGYKRCTLTINKKRHAKYVHRLLIKGYQPSEAHTVDHIDHIAKHNNYSTNLRWATSKEQGNNKTTFRRVSRAYTVRHEDYTFKPVPVSEANGVGGYEASSKGGIIKVPDGTYPYTRGYIQGSYLKAAIKGKVLRIHRMVCAAWHGVPSDAKGMVVNHIDHDKLNNDANNLEWCTPSHNSNMAVEAGRIKCTSVSQFTLEGGFMTSYRSFSAASKATGANVGGIQRCCKRQGCCGGFKWRYTTPSDVTL